MNITKAYFMVAAGGERGHERTEGGARLHAVTDIDGNALTVGQQL